MSRRTFSTRVSTESQLETHTHTTALCSGNLTSLRVCCVSAMLDVTYCNVPFTGSWFAGNYVSRQFFSTALGTAHSFSARAHGDALPNMGPGLSSLPQWANCCKLHPNQFSTMHYCAAKAPASVAGRHAPANPIAPCMQECIPSEVTGCSHMYRPSWRLLMSSLARARSQCQSLL